MDIKLIPEASIQIQIAVEEVFDAIVDPHKITKYFISESSGLLEEGKEVSWKFPEFQERFKISNIKIEKYKSVEFVWDPETTVKISLESLPDNSTVVRVSEDGKQLSEQNLKWLAGNSGGWANFLACMKAYLEYGIELRKGAFDFMRKSDL